MPAPAPCASTKQARASSGACSRPETRRSSSSVIVTGCAVELIRAGESDRDEQLESAVDEPLAVERLLLRVHHLGKPRVLHHLGVDAIRSEERRVGKGCRARLWSGQ